jgi:di/tricarboxylate transporter
MPLAMLAGGLMVAARCISASTARQSIEWQVLVTIAAAFGLGAALEKSGAAEALATLLVDVTRNWGNVATLAAIYLATMVLTEMVTNNAAAVLMFPFCLSAARLLDVDPRPLLIAITLAASASFATPIGYQTNMMVFGPGGYRFTDFLRVGLPLNLTLWLVAILLIPLWWPW